jgi:hypothetical protein
MPKLSTPVTPGGTSRNRVRSRAGSPPLTITRMPLGSRAASDRMPTTARTEDAFIVGAVMRGAHP